MKSTTDEADAKALTFYATRIRDLTRNEQDTERWLSTVHLMIREAIKHRGFPGYLWTEFRDFFDARHDARPQHSAPQAMVSAMKWLAANGHKIGFDVTFPPTLNTRGGGYPKRDILQRHVEVLAMLIEAVAEVLTRPHVNAASPQNQMTEVVAPENNLTRLVDALVNRLEKPRLKRGGKRKYDPKLKKRIGDAWATGQHKRYSDCDTALDLEPGTTKRVLDTSRK